MSVSQRHIPEKKTEKKNNKKLEDMVLQVSAKVGLGNNCPMLNVCVPRVRKINGSNSLSNLFDYHLQLKSCCSTLSFVNCIWEQSVITLRRDEAQQQFTLKKHKKIAQNSLCADKKYDKKIKIYKTLFFKLLML